MRPSLISPPTGFPPKNVDEVQTGLNLLLGASLLMTCPAIAEEHKNLGIGLTFSFKASMAALQPPLPRFSFNVDIDSVVRSSSARMRMFLSAHAVPESQGTGTAAEKSGGGVLI